MIANIRDAVLMIGGLAAYVTHIATTASEAAYGFLALGVFVPPIGVINGFVIWFS